MDAAAIQDVFAAIGEVKVKRMFGGHGIYAEGLFFAIEGGKEIYLKTDERSAPEFRAAGSTPFFYEMKGKAASMSYWKLPASAYDDSDELKRWCALALRSARDAAAEKAKPKRAAASKPARRK